MNRNLFVPYTAKPRIQAENLKYVEALSVERRGQIYYSAGTSLSRLMDLIASHENLYITIGSRYDRTGYYASIRVANGDPIKMYGSNIVNFLAEIENTLESLEFIDGEEDATPEEEIPF